MFKPRAHYDPSTNALMLELTEGLSTRNIEISENILLGSDSQGRVVSLEILNGARGVFSDLIRQEAHRPAAGGGPEKKQVRRQAGA